MLSNLSGSKVIENLKVSNVKFEGINLTNVSTIPYRCINFRAQDLLARYFQGRAQIFLYPYVRIRKIEHGPENTALKGPGPKIYATIGFN